MKPAYYSVVGINGGIVTDTYERALLCKKYLRGHVLVKKHPNFQEAEEALLDHLTEVAPWGCPLPDHCVCNKMVTISKLLRG